MLVTYLQNQRRQTIGQALTMIAGAFDEIIQGALPFNPSFKLRPALFSFVDKRALAKLVSFDPTPHDWQVVDRFCGMGIDLDPAGLVELPPVVVGAEL